MHLLTSGVITGTNTSSITQLFTSSLALLWTDGFKYGNARLFVRGVASYTNKAAKSLQLLYSHKIQLTYLIRGLHSISEEVRLLYQDVDSLIPNGKKKMFFKFP